VTRVRVHTAEEVGVDVRVLDGTVYLNFGGMAGLVLSPENAAALAKELFRAAFLATAEEEDVQ
jgi:hypothetical protein